MYKILSILFLALIANTQAANQTGQFTVSAQLQPSCNLLMDNVNFGGVDSTVNKDVLVSLNFTCNKGANASLLISNGNSNSSFSRYMTTGLPNSDKLYYNLYNPADSSLIGADGNSIALQGQGIPTNFQVSAILNSGQYVKPGIYTDNLTITLTY